MQSCTPTPIPLSPSRKWEVDNDDPETRLHDEDHTLYRSLIRRLNWLTIETRPDIKFAVMKLQHRSTAPTTNDM
jgi:DNA-directed RNA polymerase subunit L